MLQKSDFGPEFLGPLQKYSYSKIQYNDMAVELFGIRYMRDHAPEGEDKNIVLQHMHDFYEYFYVVEGNFHTYTQDKQYAYTAGQYGLLIPGLPHGHPMSAMQGFAIRFRIETLPAYEGGTSSRRELQRILQKAHPAPMTDADDGIWKDFCEIVEQSEKDAYPEETMLLLFRHLLRVIRTYRNREEDARFVTEKEMRPRGKDILTDAMMYLQSHCLDDITPEDVADHVHISYSHLARIFSEQGKGSIHDHILRARIDHAQNLLLTTDLPVADIAEMCGFKYSSHFSQVFLKLVGMTATQYRMTQTKKPDGITTIL